MEAASERRFLGLREHMSAKGPSLAAHQHGPIPRRPAPDVRTTRSTAPPAPPQYKGMRAYLFVGVPLFGRPPVQWSRPLSIYGNVAQLNGVDPFLRFDDIVAARDDAEACA